VLAYAEASGSIQEGGGEGRIFEGFARIQAHPANTLGRMRLALLDFLNQETSGAILCQHVGDNASSTLPS
ncbi:hypothetical protein, partial [uncultured Thiodictyon sp.]|uniref:hypothetical protein n=1 Tax=uncultured Thiodictyon sp. TaxID=1846217 RepID=UPI0025DED4C2